MTYNQNRIHSASDASVFASEVDGTLLVVSHDSTREIEIERTLESLEGAGARVLGVLLNSFDARKAYGGYARASHYGAGYGQYGMYDTVENKSHCITFTGYER